MPKRETVRADRDKDGVSAEVFKAIIESVKESHRGTNALFEEKLKGVADTLCRIELGMTLRLTNVETEQRVLSKKVYWALGAATVLIGGAHWLLHL
jgi:hypothetical protein